MLRFHLWRLVQKPDEEVHQIPDEGEVPEQPRLDRPRVQGVGRDPEGAEAPGELPDEQHVGQLGVAVHAGGLHGETKKSRT